ncbi:hypothetical protein E2C01_014559 [Portunus trituberculatus]|uniref:Uncharacterized protein n=1 Tax=Portunus trituberculatus TaxID=210409 RepID=A0A5B7DJ56_PORTR|nr:hypothetical protein [Portunus trituberculatus]
MNTDSETECVYGRRDSGQKGRCITLCLQTVQLRIDKSALKCACVRGLLVVIGLHVSAAAAVAVVRLPQ